MPEDDTKNSSPLMNLTNNGGRMPTSQEMVKFFNGHSYSPNPQTEQEEVPGISIQPVPSDMDKPTSHEPSGVAPDNSNNPYAVFQNLPVNVRAANEAVLNGQPIENREVYWQFDNDSKSYYFWQMFDEDAAIYWDAVCEKFSIKCKKENGDIVDLNGATLGFRDDLAMWVPQYRQLTTLEILIKNEFSSIKPQEMFSLITLVSRADPSGIVSGITIRQLSDLTGYSKDTTLRHIDSLKRSKIIKETSKVSKLKKKGLLQEKQARIYKILLGDELIELDGISFSQLEDRMG